MATIARQPFAPLDSARLQALTSTKNRQNAVLPLASKRKAPAAWSTESDDGENVDPGLFSKRCKATGGSSPVKDVFLKKPAFTLMRALVPNDSFASASTSPKRRNVLKPKAPSSKLGNCTPAKKANSSPSLSLASLVTGSGSGAPNHNKNPLQTSPLSSALRRSGILSSRRRTATSHRVTPYPTKASNVGFAAPFSLDAALKGTLLTYKSRLATSSLDASLDPSASWSFDIHEDTPEQEMTNLLQHSTCVLDISSDEESELKARRERAEGRDKENIPPSNDASQTSLGGSNSARALAATADEDDMSIEKSRNPLGQLNTADYYANGCDESTVVLVEEEVDETLEEGSIAAKIDEVVVAPEATVVEKAENSLTEIAEVDKSVDAIMGCRDVPTADAALLEPIEGTGESFQLWESGSAKDDDGASTPAKSPAPQIL